MTPAIRYGLVALIVVSAGAAVLVSVLIARRQDLPAAARRAFLLSNVALILCLASAVAGVSLLPTASRLGVALIGLAVLFLVIKFVLVRKFAHLIRQSRPPGKSNASVASR
jgi:hypothetical protein